MCIPHREVGDEEVELDHASATTLHLCGEWLNLRKVLGGIVARYGMLICTVQGSAKRSANLAKQDPGRARQNS